MYQVEHDEMYASIRDGNPINNGARMCNATMMGIMGRIAGYTGKQVTWDQALNSKQDLFPKDQELGNRQAPRLLRPFPAPRTLLRRMVGHSHRLPKPH